MTPDEQTQDLRPTFEDVTETLKVLAGKESESHWDSGDLAYAWLDGIAYGERESELGRLANATGYEYGSLRERVDCSSFYSVGDRDYDLSWSHYNRARRGNTINQAKHWLARANENQWSVRDMEKKMKEENPKPEPEPPTLREALLVIDAALDDALAMEKSATVNRLIEISSDYICKALSAIQAEAVDAERSKLVAEVTR